VAHMVFWEKGGFGKKKKNGGSFYNFTEEGVLVCESQDDLFPYEN